MPSLGPSGVRLSTPPSCPSLGHALRVRCRQAVGAGVQATPTERTATSQERALWDRSRAPIHRTRAADRDWLPKGRAAGGG